MAALAGLARVAESEPLTGSPATPLLPEPVTGSVTEHGAKLFLRRLGVPVVDGDVANTPEDAIRLAVRLGFPVVVKVNSPDIPHKSKVGAIRIGLEDEESVKSAFNHVLAISRGAVPEARLDGVLVERYRPGIEMIVGAVRDPVFGPVTLVGLGGIHTEVLGDVAIAPAPVTRAGAARMVSRLAARKLLSGVDLDGLYEIVTLVSRYFALSQLGEIEINPLVWTGEKWEALDALIGDGSATRGG
jgi:acetyl-CoA synthetase